MGYCRIYDIKVILPAQIHSQKGPYNERLVFSSSNWDLFSLSVGCVCMEIAF